MLHVIVVLFPCVFIDLNHKGMLLKQNVKIYWQVWKSPKNKGCVLMLTIDLFIICLFHVSIVFIKCYKYVFVYL
jgi:hypothetical protein